MRQRGHAKPCPCPCGMSTRGIYRAIHMAKAESRIAPVIPKHSKKAHTASRNTSEGTSAHGWRTDMFLVHGYFNSFYVCLSVVSSTHGLSLSLSAWCVALSLMFRIIVHISASGHAFCAECTGKCCNTCPTCRGHVQGWMPARSFDTIIWATALQVSLSIGRSTCPLAPFER